MDKFRTQGLGGLPFTLDDFRWFFGRLAAPNEGIYQAFNNLLRGFGDNFIVQGVVASGSSPNVAITEGWVILDGELIKVDAQTGINTTTNNKFKKVITFDSRGNKAFQNGSIEDTYEINRAVVQGTIGNLDFDGIRIFKTEKILADSSETTVEFKKKIIEIGDWNMDTDDTVDVNHGIDISKIRSIFVIIIGDSGSVDLLDKIVSSTDTTRQGGVELFASLFIRLSRLTGGLFDNTSFNSTSFNRGFVTIEFEG